MGNLVVFLLCLLMAVLLTWGWWLSPHSDVREDEVKVWPRDRWRWLAFGVGLFVILTGAASQAITQGDPCLERGINPLFAPLGFAPFFPLWWLKDRYMGRQQ